LKKALLILSIVLCVISIIFGVVESVYLVYCFINYPEMSEPVTYVDVLSNSTTMFRPDISTVIISITTTITLICLLAFLIVRFVKHNKHK